MKLFAYRGSEPNFGDELNHYLLPRLFADFFDEDDATLFLGIGSILSDRRPAKPLKVVFGSGYGGVRYGAPPELNDRWKVYCVRGPLSAGVLNLGAHCAAADPAIYLNRYIHLKAQKKYRFSLMPHWQSLHRAPWARLAEEAGVHLIDPRDAIDEVLDQILASEVVLAEAMHGAIVADALRVPWIALRPTDASHRFKWFDWAKSLDICLKPVSLAPASAKDALHSLTGRVYSGRLVDKALWILDAPFESAALASLKNAMAREPTLSTQAALDRGMERLDAARAMIVKDFGKIA